MYVPRAPTGNVRCTGISRNWASHVWWFPRGWGRQRQADGRASLGSSVPKVPSSRVCLPLSAHHGGSCAPILPLPHLLTGATYLVEWTGGTERAMVVDGYRLSRLPRSDVEVRALTDKPLALRYRPSQQA